MSEEETPGRKAWPIGTHEDAMATAIAALGLVANLRGALGDPKGRLMQGELIERAKAANGLAVALRDVLSTFREDEKTVMVSVERQEAWMSALKAWEKHRGRV